MIEVQDKAMCCGCSACASRCPKQCIHMLRDEEGFLYPVVDKGNCVDCGVCEMVCPFLNKTNPVSDKTILACVHRDENIRKSSSSGGFFSALAEDVILKGGYVFGAALCGGNKVMHIAVRTIEDLARLRGSKYVQSSIGDAYLQCRTLLNQNKEVLFSGTPCQIKGLYSFLDKPYPNLTTLDFICHGVPSPGVWEAYLQQLSARYGAAVKTIFFRDKAYGWKTYAMRIAFENGQEYLKKADEDLYLRGFVANLYLRPSCHNCKVKGGTSGADFTVADFWGVERILPQFSDNAGVSLVICNTDKAKKMSGLPIETVCVSESVLSKNPSYFASSPVNKRRRVFFGRFRKNDIDVLIEKMLRPNLINRINIRISRLMRKVKNSGQT